MIEEANRAQELATKVARLERELQQERENHARTTAALRSARPYVFNRILPPNHPEHDWRSQTAMEVLEIVDAELKGD